MRFTLLDAVSVLLWAKRTMSRRFKHSPSYLNEVNKDEFCSISVCIILCFCSLEKHYYFSLTQCVCVCVRVCEYYTRTWFRICIVFWAQLWFLRRWQRHLSLTNQQPKTKPSGMMSAEQYGEEKRFTKMKILRLFGSFIPIMFVYILIIIVIVVCILYALRSSKLH